MISLKFSQFCSQKESYNSEQTPVEQIPLHLRPYDKQKYEQISPSVKYTTGYALLDVEPFPRAMIMKLCYNILYKVQILPQDVITRIYIEEKIKWIMQKTDEITDVRELENLFGYDAIEIFIESLISELDLIDDLNEEKPWIPRSQEGNIEFEMQMLEEKENALKHQYNPKPDREKLKIVK